MNDIIYFEFNNWFSGRDYPIGEKYKNLVNGHYFSDKNWVIENKLVVVIEEIDMSTNWCVSAPKSWVEINLPELLTDDYYDYNIIQHFSGEEIVITYTKKYSDFIIKPDEDGDIIGRFDTPFMEYIEENIGIHFIDKGLYNE